MKGGAGLNLNLINESLPGAPPPVGLARVTGEGEPTAEGWQAECETVPDGNPIVCNFTQTAISALPQKNEVWIVFFHPAGEGFFLSKLPNATFPIHSKTSIENSVVIKPPPEGKVYITDDLATQIVENAVLGQKLKSILEDTLDQLNSLKTSYNTHTHVVGGLLGGAVAAVTTAQSTIVPATIKGKLSGMLSKLIFFKK